MVVNPEEHQQSGERDLATVDAESWPRREFPPAEGRRPGSVPVVIKQSILNAIYRHGQQYPDVEVCGVLVGCGYHDNEGPFIYFEGGIRGDHAGSRAAQVTFTDKTWNHIYEVLDNAWPDKRILGWYHTHPGFGVFLSGMDLFIHENFFDSPEQVAFVYDPLGGDEGLFVWQSGEAVKSEFLVEKDAEEDPPRRPASPKPLIIMEEVVSGESVGDNKLFQWIKRFKLFQWIEQLPRWWKVVTVALVVLSFVAILWAVVVLPWASRGVDSRPRPTPPLPIPKAVERVPAESSRSKHSPSQDEEAAPTNADEKAAATDQNASGRPPTNGDTPEQPRKGETRKPTTRGPPAGDVQKESDKVSPP